MLSLLFAVALLDPPHGEVFDDWEVACDNVKRCEATALQAPIQFGDDHWYEGDDPAILTNASVATIDGLVLTSSAKGRGIGDCGTSQSWVWDGKTFRMIEARVLVECRGSVNWLTVFRATPEWG